MPIALSINVNKVALIRNSRSGNSPDPVIFAQRCLDAGCQGITVHPRPDQRHIRPDDVRRIAKLLQQYPDAEFNIEGNPFEGVRGSYPGLVALVEETGPHQCTLVPDNSNQLTSDHGFDLAQPNSELPALIHRIQKCGTRVSLFMDADLEQIQRVPGSGADRIELYTGQFADNYHLGAHSKELEAHIKAARLATSLGLGINAGHDLNLQNLTDYARLPGLMEVSIGHAFTIDCLYLGLEEAMQRYLAILAVSTI